MLFIYNVIILFAGFLLKIVARFVPKIRLFVDGRKSVFATLSATIKPTDQVIWFHAASLGEYEQGLPLIEQLKSTMPSHKIVLTFFSPSGFEIRKNNTLAHVTVYLPLDTAQNVSRFLDIVHPEMVFFIKYEFWPNYLHQLQNRNIKTYLVSGVFRDKQVFFRWYGDFYRKALGAFTYFFVQNDSSKKLLKSIGFHNVKVSGDTRFDRVSSILLQDNTLDFVQNFKNNTTTIVIGSSWPTDDKLLVPYINNSANVKFIMAPHNINQLQINDLKKSITKKTMLWSEKNDLDLASFEVLIVDTIGILTKIYAYSDIAYVGGGYGSPGVHNILEPATFGVPIVIGSNYSHFAEATALVHLGGCLSVSNQVELNEVLDSLLQNQDIRLEKGHICSTFVQMNSGATHRIVSQLQAKS